jgi:hypothetical protein
VAGAGEFPARRGSLAGEQATRRDGLRAHPADPDAAVTVTEDDEGVPSIQSLLYAAASDITIERVRAWV